MGAKGRPVFEILGGLNFKEDVIRGEVTTEGDGEVLLGASVVGADGGLDTGFRAGSGIAIDRAKGMLEESGETIAVCIGIGIAGEGDRIAGARTSSKGDTGTPVGADSVIRGRIWIDEDKSVTVAIRSSGPGWHVEVLKALDIGEPCGVDEGDFFTAVTEI